VELDAKHFLMAGTEKQFWIVEPKPEIWIPVPQK